MLPNPHSKVHGFIYFRYTKTEWDSSFPLQVIQINPHVWPCVETDQKPCCLVLSFDAYLLWFSFGFYWCNWIDFWVNKQRSWFTVKSALVSATQTRARFSIFPSWNFLSSLIMMLPWKLASSLPCSVLILKSLYIKKKKKILKPHLWLKNIHFPECPFLLNASHCSLANIQTSNFSLQSKIWVLCIKWSAGLKKLWNFVFLIYTRIYLVWFWCPRSYAFYVYM